MDIDYGTFTTKIPNPLRRLWIGTCTIYEYQDVTDAETFQTKQRPVAVVTNEPCRLSYSRSYSSGDPTKVKNGVSVLGQDITLFIRPDLPIKKGSLIEITQHGVTTLFKGSGFPAVYTNHQEVDLELAEETV